MGNEHTGASVPRSDIETPNLSRSTGCVYPLVPVDSGGATEATLPEPSANTPVPVLRANGSSNTSPAATARRWP